jgi:uncharacterized protein (DUF433 family)
MARYSLNLPAELKREAEATAAAQGVSLNQFILWAVAEKVGSLQSELDDPTFPRIAYRRGAAGRPTPLVRGTGVRVQTLLVAAESWGMSEVELAEQFGLERAQVADALAFCEAHRAEVDALIAADSAESAHGCETAAAS